MSNKKNKGGRPRKYNTPEEMEEAIESYFNGGCNTKTIYVGKNAEPVTVPVPTMTGLAIYLGFKNRASMYDYWSSEEFSDTIAHAHARIEQHYEELAQVEGKPGQIFILKNLGWKDKQEHEVRSMEIEVTNEDEEKDL